VRLDRRQELEINNRLKRPLGGHGRGGKLDRGVIHRGREAAQKRFWTKGEDRAGGQVCDVTFLGAELQVKGESRYGEAGQDATRWLIVRQDPVTMLRRKTLNFTEKASAVGL
jgi:hypothetical protein